MGCDLLRSDRIAVSTPSLLPVMRATVSAREAFSYGKAVVCG
jgi:hypothetical protein